MLRLLSTLLTLCVAGVLVAPFAYRALDGSDRLARLMQGGQVEAESGDWVAARLRFEQILMDDPDNIEARLGLARAFRAGGQFETAATHLIHILADAPDTPAARIEFGEMLFLAGHLDESRTHLDRAAVTEGPLLPRAIALSAAHAAVEGDDARARDLADAALANDPTLSSAYATLAAVALRDDAFDTALAVLDRAREAGAETLSLGLLRLGIFERTGRTGQMAAALEDLAQRFPDTPEIALARARWLADRPGDATGEIGEILAALVRDHSDDRAFLADLTGEMADLLGPEAAIAILEEVADDGAFENEIAVLEAAQGNRDAAIARLETEIASGASVEGRNASRLLLGRLLDPVGALDRRTALADEVLQSDPSNVSAHTLRGEAALQAGDFNTAIAHLRSALSARPDATEIILLLARAHALSGSPELAQERLSKAVEISGHDPDIALRYARLVEGRQGARAAGELVDIALGQHPGDRTLLVRRAQLALATGDLDTARRVHVQLSAAGGDDDLLAALRVAITAQTEGLDETLARLQAEMAEASDAGAVLALATAQLRAGHPGDALQLLDGAVAAEPERIDTRLLRADTYLALGALNEAETDLAAAVALAPAQPEISVDLARLQLSRGRAEAADDTIRRALERDPEHYELAVLHAYRLDTTGQDAAARQAYQSLALRAPEDPRVAGRLGLLLVVGDRSEAEHAQARRITAPFDVSDDPERQSLRGWILQCTGDPARGGAMLRDALVALPSDPVVLARAGISAIAAGDDQQGRDLLGRAAGLARAGADVSDNRLLGAVRRAVDALAAEPGTDLADLDLPCRATTKTAAAEPSTVPG